MSRKSKHVLLSLALGLGGALSVLWLLIANSTIIDTPVTADDWHAILNHLRQVEYQLIPATSDNPKAYQANNPAHDLHTTFTAAGIWVTSQTEVNPNWSWGLTLSGYGYEPRRYPIGPNHAPPRISAEANRLEYQWGNLTEWYVNDERGLKQGFTLIAPPEGQVKAGEVAHGEVKNQTLKSDTSELVIEMTLTTSLIPQLGQTGQSIRFINAHGETVLHYDSLYVYDATGRRLPARFAIDDLEPPGQPLIINSPADTPASSKILIVIDDQNAVYPVTIDPLLTRQVAKLTASDGATNDRFGFAVAISGDTVVVGADLEDDGGISAGAAYIFERNQGGADNWGEVTKLTASDAAAGDQFGFGVAISGDVIVVGAVGDNSNTGAAYIFERNQGGANNWGEVTKLTANDPVVGNRFGFFVAIDEDTVVVGAREGDGATMNTGAAYIFERNQGGVNNWGEVTKLTASDGATGDRFGFVVAISGDAIVVGADLEDERGADAGAAYIFERNQGGANNWGEVTKLTASDGAAGDGFGFAVAISGDAIVVGAVGDNSNTGAAYIFERNQGGANNWGEVTKLTASDAAADDQFGFAVAINGDAIVVGADLEDERGADAGAAYIFERNQGGANNWGELSKLTAGDGAAGDQFGFAVAISGDAIVVGADFGDSGAANTGAAYVYRLTPSTEVTINGPILGTLGAVYNFTALISPTNATTPITYVWQATDQTPVINTTGLSHTVPFSWTITGLKTITVTAANLAGIVTAAHVITIGDNVADLSVTKLDRPDPATQGEVINYAITVKNNGFITATGIKITDTLPPGLSLPGVTPTGNRDQVSAAGISCVLGDNLLFICDVLTPLPPGSSLTIDLSFSALIEGVLTNQVEARASQPDPDLTNNIASATTTITAARADLGVSMVAIPASATFGQALTYTLTITNNGPTAASGVTLLNPLPTGLAFKSASASQGNCYVSNEVVACALSLIMPETGITVTLVVTPLMAGVISNTARVGAGIGVDDNPANNEATAVIMVEPGNNQLYLPLILKDD